MELDEVISIIRDARFSRGLRCPRCGSAVCVRYGTGRRRQRYRCNDCRRTFNDLTGTPAAWTKKLALWPDYALCLAACVSLRKAAARLEVHLSTSFRWRHRQLAPLREDGDRLEGWIELTSAWLAYSEKGRRDLDRPARSGRLREVWPTAADGVNVVIAVDRTGHAVTGTKGRAPTRRLTFDEIDSVLRGRIRGATILLAADGSYGPAARFARLSDGEFHDVRGYESGPCAAMLSVRNAVAYRDRLLGWLKPFRGVATRYLVNYLAWHLVIDAPLRQGLPVRALRWPLALPRAGSR